MTPPADATPATQWIARAESLGMQGRVVEAERAYREAVSLDPASADARFGLAAALASQGRWTEAEAAYLECARLAPGSADPWIGAANARLHAGERLGAIDAFGHAARADTSRAAEAASHALLAMQLGDERSAQQVFEAHLAWARAFLPPTPARPARASGGTRIRIGYVSPAFHASAMSFALAPVIARHDRSRFHLTAYAEGGHDDAMRRRLRSGFDHWRDTQGLDDAALARQVRADGIDVLVDLAGHTPGHRLGLFARRPAPVQLAWLDYFNTTGVAAIDALVVDDACLARPLAQSFVERLVSAGPVRYPYEAPADAPAVPAGRPARPFTFGSFARTAKLCPTTWDAWAAALRAVPDSRLVLKSDAMGEAVVRERMAAALATRGIDTGRLELRPASPHSAMLAEYGDVDAVLDTAPCNGGITTLEALWMGRPVVTLAGDTLVGRQGEAILTALGRSDWVARDGPGFAAIAASLAGDASALAREHSTLRGRLAASPCCDTAAFTARLEALLASLLAGAAASPG